MAIEASDLTLVTGDLRAAADAIRLSRATMRNIRQNLFLAFACHAISVLAAAVVLYPLLGIRLSPIVAATVMVLSSLSVVSNANRLRRFTSPRIGPPTGGDDGATVTGPAPRSAAPPVRP